MVGAMFPVRKLRDLIPFDCSNSNPPFEIRRHGKGGARSKNSHNCEAKQREQDFANSPVALCIKAEASPEHVLDELLSYI